MLSEINAGGCEFSRLVSTANDKPRVLNTAEDKALEKSDAKTVAEAALSFLFPNLNAARR